MTKKCIELARSCTQIPFNLIIVESGSQYFIDDCDIYIHEKVVTTPEIAHNLGFKASNSEYTVLLTNDVYVSYGWIEKLLDCFIISDCGASTLASTQFGHTIENKIEEGNWWSVAMIKKEVFEKVGYYDERFINSWCDTDLLVRMYKEGYKMYRNFNCVVEHLIGQTIYKKDGFQKNYEDGRILFNEKHKDCGLQIFEACK